MPPVIVAAATEIGTVIGAELGTSAAITAAIVSTAEFAIYAGLVIGINLLLPKPSPNLVQQTPLKQSIPPRRSGYGRARLSGYYMFFNAYQDEAQDVIAVHQGRVDAFERWFLNDDEVKIALAAPYGEPPAGEYHVLTPDGTKYGPNSDHVYCDFRFGLPTEVAYSYIFNNIPAGSWPSNARGDNIASFAFRYVQPHPQDQQSYFPNGAPQPSCVARLLRIYDPRLNGLNSQGPSSSWQWSANPACAVIDYLTDPDHGMGLPFASFVQPSIADYVTAANICDEQVETANISTTTTRAQVAGQNNLNLASIQGLAVGVQVTVGVGSADVEIVTVAGFPSGNPTSNVYFTTNLVHDHPQGDDVQWQANGAASVARYEVNGAFDFTQDPIEVLSQILGTMDGWLGQKGDGSLRCYAGKYYEPTVIFDDDAVVGYSVQHFLTDEEAVNQIQTTWTDPNFKFNSVDAPPWDDLADQEARGRIRPKRLNLPWVQTLSQARRLAKRTQNRYSQELRGTVTTNLYGMNGLGERYIRLRISENASLHDLPIEIQKVRIDLSKLELVFEWIAADPAIDEWSLAEETGNGTSSTTGGSAILGNGGLVAPSILATSVVDSVLNAGGLAAQIQIEASSPLGQGVNWIVQWSPYGSTSWQSSTLTNIPDGSTVTLLTGIVLGGGFVNVQVAYVTAGGQSPWSSIVVVPVGITGGGTLEGADGAPLAGADGATLNQAP